MPETNYHILVVDDEADILEFTAYALSKAGYKVTTAHSGNHAILLSKATYFDLYLLDVKMPGLNGIETAQELKLFGKNKIPLLVFLSASAEEYTQLAAYDMGADEYITKPIKPQLLVSRVQAILKRKLQSPESTSQSTVLEYKHFLVDKINYTITHQGIVSQLPKKEFKLFLLLIENQNRIVNREEIMQKVWEQTIIVGDRTIDVHVRKLRERFGNDIITTIKGIGYQFIG